MRILMGGAIALSLALALTACNEPEKSGTTGPGGTTGGKDQKLLATCGSPVNFAGIDHCPYGNASLVVNAGVLEVSGFGGGGNDGVVSDLANVTSWSQTADIDWGNVGNGKMVFKAISDAQVSATMTIQQDGLSSSFKIWSDFTGGINMRYRAELWGSGSLIATQSNLTSSDRILFTDVIAKAASKGQSLASDTWRHTPSFDRWNLQSPNPGACDFSYRPTDGTTFPSVTLPNGLSYSGVDKIEMIETTAPGHYPYANFQKMEMTGTIAGYDIRDESAQ